MKDEEEDFSLLETVGGHSQAVTSLEFSSSGSFLVSGSKDQTTRVFAKVKDGKNSGSENWVEISRAQIHGYDINDLALLNITGKEGDSEDYESRFETWM